MPEGRRRHRQAAREVVRGEARSGLGGRDALQRVRRAGTRGVRSYGALGDVQLIEGLAEAPGLELVVPARPPILQVRGLRKSFGAALVLKGIDLDVAAQELVFVI